MFLQRIFFTLQVVVFVFTGRTSIVTPFIYYRFLGLRYSSRRNPYTRAIFHELRYLKTALINYRKQYLCYVRNKEHWGRLRIRIYVAENNLRKIFLLRIFACNCHNPYRTFIAAVHSCMHGKHSKLFDMDYDKLSCCLHPTEVQFRAFKTDYAWARSTLVEGDEDKYQLHQS